jgi:ATP-dependent helicase/nuclease subunit B
MEIVPAGVLYAPAADVTIQAPLGADKDEIEKERAKKLVRKGLLLNDSDVLEAMEHQGSGRFLPVKFNKDGQAMGDSLATAEQLGELVTHIDNVLLEMGREMRRGMINADPYYKGPMDNSCLWCPYKEACRFDENGGDSARYLKKLKTDQVWSMIGDEKDGRI